MFAEVHGCGVPGKEKERGEDVIKKKRETSLFCGDEEAKPRSQRVGKEGGGEVRTKNWGTPSNTREGVRT